MRIGGSAFERVSLVLVASVLTACATRSPAPPTPDTGLTSADRFIAADADAPRPGSADLAWWQRFDDPELGAWIERALAHNLDLAQARARTEEARALLRAAQAGAAPQIGAQARIEANSRTGAQRARRIEPSASLTLDWDADLWGGRAAAQDAAQARLGASHALERAMRLSVAALTARAHIGWREALLERAQLLDAIALQREIARVVQIRVDAGISAALDGQRARGELAATEAEVVAATTRVRAAERALQLLAGQRPGPPLAGSPVETAGAAEATNLPAAVPATDAKSALGSLRRGRAVTEAGAAKTATDASRASAALPQLAGLQPVVLPLDLLRLRPDLRAAELAWRAARADLEVAHAAERPSLRLPGVLTLGSAASGALLAQVSASVAASLAQPLFDGGLRRAGRDAAQARLAAAEAAYRQAFQQALAEVEAALRAGADSRERVLAQQRALREADDAIADARILYGAGLAGFLDLLDAQRSALDRRQALLRARGDAARASIAGFESMGLLPP